MTTQPNTNWPAFWAEFIDGCLLAAMIFGAFAWFDVLPTVGLLYVAGVLN